MQATNPKLEQQLTAEPTNPAERIQLRGSQMYSRVAAWQVSGSGAQSVVVLLQFPCNRFGLYSVQADQGFTVVRRGFRLLANRTKVRAAAEAARNDLEEWKLANKGGAIEPLQATSLNTTVANFLAEASITNTVASWCGSSPLPERQVEAQLLKASKVNWTAARNLAYAVLARSPLTMGGTSPTRAAFTRMLDEEFTQEANLPWAQRHFLVDMLGLVLDSLPEERADLASRFRAWLQPLGAFKSAAQAAKALQGLPLAEGKGFSNLISELLSSVPAEELARRQAVLDEFMRTADTLPARRVHVGQQSSYKGILPMRMPLCELLRRTPAAAVETHQATIESLFHKLTGGQVKGAQRPFLLGRAQWMSQLRMTFAI